MLQKIIHENVQAILVTPDWPTKSWYSLLNAICVSEPIFIPVIHDTLSLCSVPGHQHPLQGRLTLRAQQVHGKNYGSKVIPMEL